MTKTADTITSRDQLRALTIGSVVTDRDGNDVTKVSSLDFQYPTVIDEDGYTLVGSLFAGWALLDLFGPLTVKSIAN